MTTLITDTGSWYSGSARVTDHADGQHLWLTTDELHRTTGWQLTGGGFCRGAICVPAPPDGQLLANSRVDVVALWQHLGWPWAQEPQTNTWSLGEGVEPRRQQRESLLAPDFVLPDLHGVRHRLQQYRGQRLVLLAWASWCRSRSQLTAWQALHEQLAGTTTSVLAVALDSRGGTAARPALEAAGADFTCLLDVAHRTAPLYGFTNVPQAVWIDEDGRIVRPAEPAGITDAIWQADPATGALPAAAEAELGLAMAAYQAAVLDWAAHGAGSAHVLPDAAIRARLTAPGDAAEAAHVHFRLGRYLFAQGQRRSGQRFLHQAAELHPDSWAIWRQALDIDAAGSGDGPAFRARLDALGGRPCHAPVHLGD